ncbi:hypothetical protein ACN47E_003114 [Coniothyrium glycines]
MQFSILALFTLAAMATATPHKVGQIQVRSIRTREERTAKEAAALCKPDQHMSCCNQSQTTKTEDSVLPNLLGANSILNFACTPINVNLLAVNDDAKANEICGQKLACCSGNGETGLINKDNEQGTCQEI